MERMGERAHGRQQQQRGWLGQPASSLPGARATPAQLVSGGGCLPQPSATGAGAHQGQTSREGERDIWWTAGTTRGGTGHLGLTHTETQRGRLRTACGQRHVDSKNSQPTPATTSTSSICQLLGADDAQNGTPCHIQHSPNTPTRPFEAPLRRPTTHHKMSCRSAVMHPTLQRQKPDSTVLGTLVSVTPRAGRYAARDKG